MAAQSELAPAWRSISDSLRRRLGDTTFQAWIARVEADAWDGQLLLLRAPSEIQDWVSTRFGSLIETSAREVLGPAARIAFQPGGAPGAAASMRAAAPGPGAATTLRPEAGFNPRYSFEQFIIGRGNHLAHAAALAVAEHPGQAYNPLFLHASPGLGKTHLLHAIGNYVLAFAGGAVVRYTTAEMFTNHFLGALSGRTLDSFKHAYRDADVLLIDDIQFLASKAKTEEEFFHTFNALHENGRQLVLTCDRLPGSLTGLQERLRERFEAGLVAEIHPPDLKTRLAILRKRAQIDGLRIADAAVLEFIAQRVTSNVRSLEGALIRIAAHNSLTQRPIDSHLAGEVLDALYPPTAEPAAQAPTVATVQEVVASHYGLDHAAMVSANRSARLTWPRQVAIYLGRELVGSSWEELGQSFGGRSHSTAMHAWRKVSARMREDPQVVDEVSIVARRLGLGSHADWPA